MRKIPHISQTKPSGRPMRNGGIKRQTKRIRKQIRQALKQGLIYYQKTRRIRV